MEKYGKDLILFGGVRETLHALVDLIKIIAQLKYWMEYILNAINVNIEDN